MYTKLCWCSQPDGRAQPTREDQVDFLLQLSQAAAGKFNQQMMYFYKYLVRHSDDESGYGSPLGNDLFFYCEVQKFKVGQPVSLHNRG